jgi:uncharacterized membrane protein SpoIIM required for sporulation
MVAEIVAEMDYLRTREQKLRDTNESTNTRVKWFAFGTMGMLVALGAWQVVYLRAYFRYVAEQLVRWAQLANTILGQSISSKGSKTGADSVVWREISMAMDLLVLLVGCRIGYIMTIRWRARTALEFRYHPCYVVTRKERVHE